MSVRAWLPYRASPVNVTSLPPPSSVSITSFDQTTIVYDLYDRDPERLALVVPGFWRDRKYPAIRNFCQSVRDLGYTVAVLDVRGHGDSGGVYGFNRHEHHDVAAVAGDVLKRKPTLSGIVLIGLSLGGAIAISTTARHPELPVTSLFLISPVARFSTIRPVVHPFSMHRHLSASQAMKKPRFPWKFWRSPKLDAIDDVGRIEVPITFVHVKDDWLIHHRHSLALFEAASEPKSLHILDVPGNYHADRIFSACAEQFDPLLERFLGEK